MTQLYEGRLYSKDGNLYADQRKRVGDKTWVVRGWLGFARKDDNGDKLTVTVPIFKDGPHHGREVKHVPGTGYVFVGKGDSSHHEDHHKRFVVIDYTTPEDPHHFAAVPGDRHFDSAEPGNTKLKADPDSIAAVITGHTAAYKDSAAPRLSQGPPKMASGHPEGAHYPVRKLPEIEPASPPPAPISDTKQPNE